MNILLITVAKYLSVNLGLFFQFELDEKIIRNTKSQFRY